MIKFEVLIFLLDEPPTEPRVQNLLRGDLSVSDYFGSFFLWQISSSRAFWFEAGSMLLSFLKEENEVGEIDRSFSGEII